MLLLCFCLLAISQRPAFAFAISHLQQLRGPDDVLDPYANESIPLLNHSAIPYPTRARQKLALNGTLNDAPSDPYVTTHGAYIFTFSNFGLPFMFHDDVSDMLIETRRWAFDLVC